MKILIAAAILSLGALSAAQAMPVAPLTADGLTTQVAQGCGPGMARNPWAAAGRNSWRAPAGPECAATRSASAFADRRRDLKPWRGSGCRHGLAFDFDLQVWPGEPRDHQIGRGRVRVAEFSPTNLAR